VRKALVLTATMAVGLALLSCSAPESSKGLSPTTTSTINPPSAPVVRAPLAPLVGYASPQPLTDSPAPLAPYASSHNQGVDLLTSAHGVWRASPSWAAVKGDGCFVVDQMPQDKSAAKSETAKFRVEKCSKKDADPNSRPAREISGY
jgi:hypothetical protein